MLYPKIDRTNKQRGLSLVELLAGLSLISVVLMLSSMAIFQFTKSFSNSSSLLVAQDQLRFLNDKIVSELRKVNTQQISFPSANACSSIPLMSKSDAQLINFNDALQVIGRKVKFDFTLASSALDNRINQIYITDRNDNVMNTLYDGALPGIDAITSIIACFTPEINSGSTNAEILSIEYKLNSGTVKTFTTKLSSLNWTSALDQQEPYTLSGDSSPPTTPSNVSNASKSTTSATLSWTASTDNNAVSLYHIYKDGIEIATSTTTTVTISNLFPSSTYMFTIKAEDINGNLSALSNSVSVTTDANPNTVTVYYKPSNTWTSTYIHYQPTGGSWTVSPGMLMSASSTFSGYMQYTISLAAANGATVCFNNGSGTWDTNGGSNYAVLLTNYTVQNNTVIAGTPAPTASPSPTPTATPVPTSTPTPIPNVSITFQVNYVTSVGQNIYMAYFVNNVETDLLMSWNTGGNWTITRSLPANSTYTYKYYMYQNTTKTWEKTGTTNRIYTIPTTTTTKSDAWGSY